MAASLLLGSFAFTAPGQTFSGPIVGGVLTGLGTSASIGGVNAGGSWAYNGGDNAQVAITLNPGTVTFDYLNYTAPSGASGLWHAVQYTNPQTFQSATYNIYVSVDPYIYASVGNEALPLTAGGNGSLNFNSIGHWTKQNIALTGTVLVDGPNEDLSFPFSVSVPTFQNTGFLGALDVQSYPSSVTMSSVFPYTAFGNYSGTLALYSGTIDGLPFTYSLTSFQQEMAFTPDRFSSLALVPEPTSCVMAAGVGLVAFAVARRHCGSRAAVVS